MLYIYIFIYITLYIDYVHWVFSFPGSNLGIPWDKKEKEEKRKKKRQTNKQFNDSYDFNHKATIETFKLNINVFLLKINQTYASIIRDKFFSHLKFVV